MGLAVVIIFLLIFVTGCEPTESQLWLLIWFSTIVAAIGLIYVLYIALKEEDFWDNLPISLFLVPPFFIAAWIVGLIVISIYNLIFQ